jgi:hypothetical protein
LQRVREIRAEIEAVRSPVLDRSCIEEAFGVRRRQAIELMHRFGGYQAGKTFLVERSSLLRQLEEIEGGAGYRQERRRRRRVAEELDRARLAMAGKAVRIEVGREELGRQLEELPGVRLRAGELRVEFAGTEELLRRLLELAVAIQNDYERFEEICSGIAS